MNHKNYVHELQAIQANKQVGKAKLCNYTVTTANGLTFFINNISRNVLTYQQVSPIKIGGFCMF